jgi:uncharacterized protein (TIGR00730 family)
MVDNGAQKASASYRLATADQDFLLRDELRALRFALEYAKAELTLRDWGVRSTVVVYGSARIPRPEDQARAPAPLRQLAPWYEVARDFARLVSLRGGALAPEGRLRDNVIATGGGPGIMEAANRGASDAGGRTIGLNIALPHEQRPNRYITRGLALEFHYFFMRKLWFAHLAAALVAFPGGFGTLDEIMEILTLAQTRKLARRIPVLLYGSEFWNEIVNFEALARHGVIARDDLNLFRFADTPQAALEILQHEMDAMPPKPTPAFAHSTTRPKRAT